MKKLFLSIAFLGLMSLQSWNNGKMTETVIRSKNKTEKPLTVKYGGTEKSYTCKPLETMQLDGQLNKK
jgi:hypothetical protein